MIRKIKLILKFMISQPGKQIFAIDIFPDVSRSKGNQKMINQTIWSVNRIYHDKYFS